MPACTSGSVSTWFTEHVNFGSTQRETVTLNSRHGFLSTGLNVRGELFGTCDLIWLKKRALGRAFLLKDFLFSLPPPPPYFSSHNVWFCLSVKAHKNSVTCLWLHACIQEYFPISGSKSTPQLWLDYKVAQDPGASICLSLVLLPRSHAK